MQRRLKRVEFSSKRENVYKAEKFVEEICDIYNIFNNYYGNITIAVTEAVENAIKHGNEMDENKDVVLSFESRNSALIFTISDQGNGFNPSLVPDPTVDENATAGRGLYLMKTLSDNFAVLDNGRTIELVFEIASINHETTVQRRSNLKNYFHGDRIQLNQDLRDRNENS